MEAKNWISVLRKGDKVTDDEKVSFSTFYSSVLEREVIKTPSQLLPLLADKVTEPSTVRHVMAVLKNITENMNPGQNPVITCDQPVYALSKQIQWLYPDEFNNIVMFMGPMHIEQAFMGAIGNWLEGCGWAQVYEAAGISTPGRVESFLKVSGIKRTRYAHQVALAALIMLAQKSYIEQTNGISFEEWQKNREQKSPTVTFWFTVIKLETLLFTFVRSVRESNFDLFVQCLEEILPWMCVLDHTNYTRWLPVFIMDMKHLPMDVLTEFMKGNFTVKNSVRQFSALGTDQAHEQINKLVKINRGTIGILDNDTYSP